MDSRGLLVRVEAIRGKEAQVEDFLRSALPLIREETTTTAWFAVRFGKSEYGIFDVFPDEEARAAHLNGPVAQAAMGQVGILFTKRPEIHELDVLAEKLPAHAEPDHLAKAMLLTFEAKAGHEKDVEDFLRSARSLVDREPRTAAWFAIRLANGEYGIFDAFPDSRARVAHLAGQVPRELAKNALSLLGSVPDVEMLNVVADKLPD